jgi:hypothetical protein
MSRILARAFGPIPPRASGVGDDELLPMGFVEADVGALLLSLIGDLPLFESESRPP